MSGDSANDVATSQGADDQNSRFTNLVSNNKNCKTLKCERCGSVVLLPGKAVIKTHEFYLPHMKKKTEGTSEDGETLTDFWMVDDMFTFENVGFSNTVGTTKYLICADCEIGPIGWHDVQNKKEFYIALDRVEHV